ncbi:MAG: carbamate kinase [Lachnospiraceae bacterium]|nr:carbamate kinase [Lachnospiraceae bacterium]
MASRIVIALGGNALGNTPDEQQMKIDAVAESLVGLIAQGYEIIISHGNGPQVGTINLAFSEGSERNDKIPFMPMPECTAMSQGYIGYHLQKGILKELRRRGMPWHVSTMITQIEVDPEDNAFKNPTKPIGAYYTKEQAETIMAQYPQKVFKEDAGRGYRQMVASPKPVDIVEKDSILNLLDNEFIVIACGGGGIPVIRKGDGIYEGVDAVIDKDFASSKLAEMIDAEYFFILTAVDRVSINWGKPDQKDIEKMTVTEAEKYCEEGHFAPGSMLPKVMAAINFAKSKQGRKAVIASLEKAPLAIQGLSGTEISL